MLMEHASGSRKLRAPQGDGQTLVEPPLVALPEVLAQNRQLLSQAEYDVQGRALSELIASARADLLKQALDYTSRYRGVTERMRQVAADSDAPFVLSGHQPQLFHPGVWYKNFVLGAVAQQAGGVGIHLLIDSDLCRGASIRVPTGSVEAPHLEAVVFDEPGGEVPYEERSIRNPAVFQRFGRRVEEMIRPLVSDPLIEAMWPLAVERNPRQMNLGLRIAQGRHALEAEWRNETLELPQSTVCGLPEFLWFLAHVLAHLPRFWGAYNDALTEYRRAHRQRTRAHPVPDLAEVDGWLEAPFWMWSADDPRRRPIFARQTGDELIITDRHAHQIRLAISADRDATLAVEQLRELPHRGLKIRTRALTTTLFARLVLSDMFLHGIGGAKYDQVTDQLAEAFFGFRLPEFAAVSATLRLPIARRASEITSARSCTQQLRELRYHPERFVSGDGAGGEFIAEKWRWIRLPKTPENARERHQGIAAANEALQPYLAGMREEIERGCQEVQHRKRAEAILNSREYAFCLYPRREFERLLGICRADV